MATADKVLSVLGLFTMDAPEWTVEAAMLELGLSSSTAYDYFRSLVSAGLLVAGKSGRYGVGPAVIGLDRLARRHDPLIHDAQPMLRALVGGLGRDGGVIGLLCRSYRSGVMCVDQYVEHPTAFGISYERGRPMSLYRGAASKAILAQLPSRSLLRLWAKDQASIAQSGLGTDWNMFRKTLRSLRKEKVVITRGEIDTGLVGISAPVFDAEGIVLGSLGIVAAADMLGAMPDIASSMPGRVVEQATALTAALGAWQATDGQAQATA